MLLEEAVPHFTCQNKKFLLKIMFVAAVACPRYDEDKKTWLNGKIGCWPLVKYEYAKNKSNNRLAGTLEMKPITSVTGKVMDKFLHNKVIHAI